MNCSEVETLLQLADDEARVDVMTLHAHFRDCGFCRAAFPEVFALTHAPAPESDASPLAPHLPRGPRFGWREAAAAALLVAAAGLALVPPDEPAPRAPESTRVHDQTAAVTHQRWLDGRPFTAHFQSRRIQLNPAR